MLISIQQPSVRRLSRADRENRAQHLTNLFGALFSSRFPPSVVRTPVYEWHCATARVSPLAYIARPLAVLRTPISHAKQINPHFYSSIELILILTFFSLQCSTLIFSFHCLYSNCMCVCLLFMQCIFTFSYR